MPAKVANPPLQGRPQRGQARCWIWAVFGALFAWEGLALSHLSGTVPTLSDTFRVIMRYPAGRWALFALWL